MTSADTEAEEIIVGAIRSRYPDHAILAEESAPKIQANHNYQDPLWIIDPIDGTRNFSRRHHQFAISIAFMVQGKMEVGVVYSPIQNELFHARRGLGAFLNEKPIKASACSDLGQALVAIGRPVKKHERSLFMKRMDLVQGNCMELRRLGAASLDTCWVACGRMDAFFETVNSWDIAAGGLIAREAGALTGTMDSKWSGEIMPLDLYATEFVVAAPDIYSKLLELFR